MREEELSHVARVLLRCNVKPHGPALSCRVQADHTSSAPGFALGEQPFVGVVTSCVILPDSNIQSGEGCITLKEMMD